MVKILTLSAALFLAAISALHATVLNVPGDFATIQEALDSWQVADGDTVLVHPGTYQENIDFRGRSIFLASLFLETEDRYYIGSTVIDGGASGSVVTFPGDRKSRAALCGFTIQNGVAENGGGIRCTDSRPAIRYNIIRNNLATREGGGIFCLRSDPEITGNILADNQGEQGGGICYRDLNLMTAQVSGSESERSFVASPSFDEDKIADLRYNVLVGNSAHRAGGICSINSRLNVENNTITGNSADFGGGLLCEGSEIEITSSIVWDNYSTEGSHITGDSLTVRYSDIEGGWPGDGNIDLDPLFRRPQYRDFKLMSAACGDELNSPCIDTGSPESTDGSLGCSRGRGTAFCDMGAYGGGGQEYSYGRVLRVPYDFDTPTQAVNASVDGDTVLVYPGVHPGNIDFGGREITLASMYIINPVPELVLATVIDGQSEGPVVTFENGEGESAVLTGLTLRGGLAVNGGGVYCHYSEPEIIGNIIEYNTALSDGGGVFCFYSNPLIENNILRSNYAVSGAGILCRYSSPLIRHNEFTGNEAQQEGGAVLVRDNSLPVIELNRISGNSAVRGGGVALRYAIPTINNNIIYLNQSTRGGGFYCVGSNSSLINNVISGNSAETGGGIFCLNSTPAVTNCILYFNSADEGAQIYGGQPWVTFSDIQDGWEGIGNIDSDPLFRDFDGGDFHLSSASCGEQFDSPCIDAGSPDISDSLLSCEWGLGSTAGDIGAYGGGNTLTRIDPSTVTPEYSYGILGSFPNPFNSSTAIRYHMPRPEDVEIEIFDICGRLVDILADNPDRTGEGVVIWESGDLAAGVYFARLNRSPAAKAIKLLLIK